MKILNAQQIRAADQHTILNEPIASIDLMERASSKCFDWIIKRYGKTSSFHIFCGIGNNGGDGLAIARLLHLNKYNVICYIVEFSNNTSEDFAINLNRLNTVGAKIISIKEDSSVISIEGENNIIIDAIFGTGLTRPASGIAGEIIQKINSLEKEIIAIDIPSGLFCEDNSQNNSSSIVNATHTLSFEVPKLAFVLPDNESYCGNWHILSIGLDKPFISDIDSPYNLVTEEIIKDLLIPRDKFSHKGTFGHALIIAGSEGKMGAAVLATSACLRTGVGLATAYISQCGITILQTAVPEAMVIENIGEDCLQGEFSGDAKRTIGIGPGIGTNESTSDFLKSVLENTNAPMVIDADAINIIAQDKSLLSSIPKESIFTPHPKEFKRLVGDFSNDIEKLEKLKFFSRENNCYTVLKGANTATCCPDGTIYFNNTGNPGMATGGSGDVLTGVITSFLAQGYPSKHASIMGVYLHGLAGDIASKEIGEEALIASDIVNCLGKAFLAVSI